eukprot:499532_1
MAGETNEETTLKEEINLTTVTKKNNKNGDNEREKAVEKTKTTKKDAHQYPHATAKAAQATANTAQETAKHQDTKIAKLTHAYKHYKDKAAARRVVIEQLEIQVANLRKRTNHPLFQNQSWCNHID